MKTLIDDCDPDIRIGDRVVLSEKAGGYAGQAGDVVAQDNVMTAHYGMDVVVVRLDSGQRVWAFVACLIRSPYQNERLEEVPSV